MTISRENSSRFKKLFVSVFLYAIPFAIVFFTIFAVVNAQKKIWKSNLNKELQMHIYRETAGIENYLRGVVQDISFLADIAETSEIFSNSGEKARSDLTDMFVRFGYARGVYAQFRIIDIDGIENIRIDFKNGKAAICPENELQDKSKRPYFTNSVVMNKGLIYISKLDLNIENEKIETPYNPMIRFATPIFDKSGTKKGVLVLNYMASALIAIVKDHSPNSFDTNIKSQLLNKEGYWLYNSEQEKCWGFMFDDKKNCSMPVENPELWEKIKNSKNGIIANKQGVFAYNTVHQTETASKRLGVENIPDTKAGIKERYWKIVSYIPGDYIAAYERKSNAILFSLFGIIGVIVALIERKFISYHKQLVQKQKNLETVFDTSPVGMLLLNEKTEVIKINSVIEKLVGKYNLGDQPGNLLGCIHSIENPKGCGYSPSCPKCPIRNSVKTALQNGSSSRFAEVLSTLLIDGKKTDVWLEVNTEPVILDGKKCAVVAINNITDRKQAEEALRVSERFAHATLDAIPANIAILDEMGVIVAVNQKWRTFAEENLPENSKLNVCEGINYLSVCQTANGPNSREASAMFNGIRDVMSGKIKEFTLEYPCHSPDKKRWFNARITKFTGEKGRHIVIAHENITERKLAEDELRKLSRAVEQNPACIVITDTEGIIEYINPTFTKLTGYTLQDVLGKNPRILKSGLTPPEVYKQMWDTIKAGHDWQGEFCNRKKNGELYFENTSISPVINEAGIVTNFIANKEDITLRKKAEIEMREAVEMKSRFISTASHELRTPLTSIKEGVNLVYSETTGPLNDDQKEFLGIAKRNVDRLARLINDVLDYQKMTAGRMEFNLKPANINETVKIVEETMRPLTKEKGLQLILELDDAIPPVDFDNDKIIQVLTNLVSNAIKFTETGSIKITTSRSDNSVITAVKDSGSGIKLEDMPKLFQEFGQLAIKDADRKVGGTGLGLVISKKIVESHGGRIWVESDYGNGTTFYFELPTEKILCQTKS